jgi:serine/threonine protein kinase
MADLSGRMLGQYRLKELIGVGGMAAVYRARQESMDRDVAIKVMAAQLAANDEFVARFEREARVIAKLQHPHILPVIDFGREEGQIFLVMRMVEGGVLSERLARATLSIQQVNRFLTQIASALEYAHQRAVIHRDLKPNNVLLDEEDNVYLTDFGIAKMLAGTSTSQLSLTATGSVMGTPAYMAPEQWRSEAVDARTDIYALGIIVYEMLMGVLPFQSDTPFGMMYKHFDAPPPLPRLINPSLPEPLEQIVLRAMAKNANDRYPSARLMAEDFDVAVRAIPPDVCTQPLPRATPDQIAQATPPAQRRPTGTVATRATPTPSRQSAEYAAVPSTLARSADHPRGRGRGILVGGVLLILIAVAAVIGLLVLGGGNNNADKTQTAEAIAGLSSQTAVVLAGEQTQTAQAAVIVIKTPTVESTATTEPAAATVEPTANATPEPDMITPEPDTITPEPTEAPPETAVIMIVTPESTATETPSITPSATATETPSITPSQTPSITPSPSPTGTPTATLTPTETPDLGKTADALLALRLTQTATMWTDTPTPDIEGTVVAALTGTASAWTKTPTPTATFTRTPVPTLPPPPTRTPIPRPTLAPLSTATPRPFPTATLRPLPTITPRPLPTSPPQCNAMRTRLTANEGARTTLTPDTPTRVRQTPGLSASTLRQIPPGLMFWVMSGPQCVDNVQWWQIEGVDQSGLWTGWIGEGQNNTYWIEPYDTGPIDCPGAPPPRLVPGNTGRVTVSPPLPSRVRSSPEKASDNVIGQLQPGDTFEVITGPVCDIQNHWRWWQVRGRSVEGWVAEGPIGEYWMEPWP